MNVVSGKMNVSALVKSVVSLCSSGFLTKWILGWYLCIEFKMIWKYYKIFLVWIFSPMSSQEWWNFFLGLTLRIKVMRNLLGYFARDSIAYNWRGYCPNEPRELPCLAPIASLILLFRARRMFFSSLPGACLRAKDRRNSCLGVCEFYRIMCLLISFNLNESLMELYHDQNLIVIISRRTFNRLLNTIPHIHMTLTFRLG